MIEKGKRYLITGGTGVIGDSLCKRLLEMGTYVIVLARSKKKLKRLQDKYNNIEIVVGNVSDRRMVRNTIVRRQVDGIFHLASLAQGMQSGKSIESVITNVIGSLNILELSHDVNFVLGVSSDKVVQVSGVYGATKFLMEKMFSEFEENNKKTKYRIVRLGNIIYSHDSVLHRWKNLIQDGDEITVTDKDATRFYLTAEQSVDLIFNCLENSKDSKPYCESMKSASLENLLQAMKNKYLPDNYELSIKTIGLQDSENLHEKILEDGPFSNEVQQYTVEELEEMI